MQVTSALLVLSALAAAADARTITIRNSCGDTLWPAVFSQTDGPRTGWELGAGGSVDFDVPDIWTAGRIWARTGCSTGDQGFTCETGDCGPAVECANGATGRPPTTLSEFTFTADQDSFDVSLVNGFNVQVSIEPSGGCGGVGCTAGVNDNCPGDNRVTGASGATVGCQSNCDANIGDHDLMCCAGDYYGNNPGACTLDRAGQDATGEYFKGLCPDAYSYAYDDWNHDNNGGPQVLYSCPPGTSYVIEFCPPS